MKLLSAQGLQESANGENRVLWLSGLLLVALAMPSHQSTASAQDETPPKLQITESKLDQALVRSGVRFHDASLPPDAIDPKLLRDLSKLENFGVVTPEICYGGLPKTRDAFEALASFGVRTIASVDGAEPKVKLAKHFGIRYVHIPLGYDNVSREEALSLCRVLEECDGKVYFHCHHGRHRAPVAVAIARVTAGQIPATEALRVLQLAGTGEQYVGLWDDVRGAKKANQDESRPDLVETAEVDSLAASMVKLDENLARLLELTESKRGAKDADSDAEEVRFHLMAASEIFRELRRHTSPLSEADFHDRLEKAEELSKAAIGHSKLGHHDRVIDKLHDIQSACRSCHAAFRN